MSANIAVSSLDPVSFNASPSTSYGSMSKKLSISAELVPLIDEMLTIKSGLLRLWSGKVCSFDAIAPFQERLDSLELRHKKDGIWCGDLKAGIIPAGQGTINEIFDENHDFIDRLLENCEESAAKELRTQRLRTRISMATKLSGEEKFNPVNRGPVTDRLDIPKRSRIAGSESEGVENEEFEKTEIAESGLLDEGTKEKLLDSIPISEKAIHHPDPNEPKSEVEKRDLSSAGHFHMGASKIPDRAIRKEPGKIKEVFK